MQTMSARKNRINIQTMVVWALFCALAYVSVVLIRIPVVQFLKYEPKDVILMIGAFMYGPLAGCVMSVVVSLIEMVTVSDTGWIGAIMNILASCAFVCPAATIYWHRRTLKGAVTGLVVGSTCMVVIMLLWNALITPLYMGMPRAAVIDMLPTVFLPFNLLKTMINSALVMLLYKHVVTALRAAHLLPQAEQKDVGSPVHTTVVLSLISLLVLATAILIILAMQGII